MRKGKLVYTKRELLYIVTALLLFFQIYLQNYVRILQFWDEIVAVFCLIKILLVGMRKGLERIHTNMLTLMVFMMGLGLMSNLYAGVQLNLKPIVTDIGNTFKVFVVYIGASLYLKPIRNKKRIVDSLASVIHIFVIVTFGCMILHEFGIIRMGSDVRYGLNSFQFINNGAGQLSFMFYATVLILTLEIKHAFPRKSRKRYIAMALIVWSSTLRSRAFMYVLIYIFLYWSLIYKERKLQLNWKNGIVIAGALLLFGIDQIETYFLTKKTARATLLRYGFYTMQRYFPFGSGFATYGTDAAVKYYSSLYDEYGFGTVWGLSRTYPVFAHDTYWPAIVAQFGFFGTILMLGILLFWCKDVLQKVEDKHSYLLAIFMVVTQVSSSIATATFFHFITVGIVFLLPLIFDDVSLPPKKRGAI